MNLFSIGKWIEMVFFITMLGLGLLVFTYTHHSQVPSNSTYHVLSSISNYQNQTSLIQTFFHQTLIPTLLPQNSSNITVYNQNNNTFYLWNNDHIFYTARLGLVATYPAFFTLTILDKNIQNTAITASSAAELSNAFLFHHSTRPFLCHNNICEQFFIDSGIVVTTNAQGNVLVLICSIPSSSPVYQRIHSCLSL